MNPIEPTTCASLTTEQLLCLAAKWNHDDWRNETPKLSPDQVSLITPCASEQQDPIGWKDKTLAMIEALTTPQTIEACGRTLSFEQINEILTWAAKKDESIKAKLFPLFVGIPSDQFVYLLIHATKEQLELLKQESIREPIQHHLTLLSHDLSSAVANHNLAFVALDQQLATLDLSGIDLPQIADQESAISALRQESLITEHQASKALALAWNANRPDLIEQLSDSKEHSYRLTHLAIGTPRTNDSNPTGLYASLENHLDTIFNAEDGSPLSNVEPVLEALVKFSIWYLTDYHEIGLLPTIKDPSTLELTTDTSTKNTHSELREELFTTVERNLELLGLFTLSDLKQHKIYSKRALKTFISQNKNRLS